MNDWIKKIETENLTFDQQGQEGDRGLNLPLRWHENPVDDSELR